MREFDLIIAGASARAAAASALRAGLRPWCADLFGDTDLRAIAAATAFPPNCYPHALQQMITHAKLPPNLPLLLTGAMENHLHAITSVLRKHPLLGPDASTIQHLRELIHSPQQQPVVQGIHWCQAIAFPDAASMTPWLRTHITAAASSSHWIIKPLHSAGGVNIELLTPATRWQRPCIAQRFIPGQTLGVLWRGHATHCELLGVTKQITPSHHFACQRPFTYAGSVGPISLTPPQRDALSNLGQALWSRTPFQGLCGCDVILTLQHTLHPIEFNPRYTASVEVLEHACHFASLNPHSFPSPPRHITAKAYAYAPHDAICPDLARLFPPHAIADIPAPGSHIHAGQPICTLLTHAHDEHACLAQLHDMAEHLYTRMREPARP